MTKFQGTIHNIEDNRKKVKSITGKELDENYPTCKAVKEFVENFTKNNSVIYNAQQKLTDEQKSTARENIGAASVTQLSNIINETVTQHEMQDALKLNTVLGTQAQDWSEAKKAQARSNIGAVDASRVKSSISTNDDIPTAGAMVDYFNTDMEMQAVVKGIEQSLTDEQKAQARTNISAVDASRVKSSITTHNDIPDASALAKYVSETAITVNDQFFANTQKLQARKNIDVDGGKWVLLRTYTTDGVNKAFGDGTTSNVATTTTDGDGNALSLSAVSVVFKNTAAASANSYITCFAYCNADNESLSAGYAISTNAINTKANAQGVAMVLPERGYYRSLSVYGGINASVNLCENPSQMFSTASSNTIKRIKITLGAIPPEGDIIEIWGIKA